ncbi:putative magnesium transporter NIPA7 [Hibiscus syriacus]|uniref:Probable magnesium transporter n=1 Tax=Hibiscus syriacus TaxID=106335 RepID=A0A6A3BN52_HIBSY|nr:putative magnesium transporter NIPA7 [Hibiscus syriacus]
MCGLSENSKGVILAVASSAFIGSSFILKKKGLKRGGISGVGGFTYLLEPLWWAGMITMIIGEIANFVAYIYAPAVLVTPLGALIAAICVVTQLIYLNKALDTFNAALVSPVYYVMFTTLTIIASVIMFKDWSGQNAGSIASEICGFITVLSLSGTIILHVTREQEPPPPVGTVTWFISGDSIKNPEVEPLITHHRVDEYYEP